MEKSFKGKVLLVDDEVNALKVLAAILTDEGYDVLMASSVDRAIKLLEDNPPDVIVTDIRMPGKSGLDLFEHVSTFAPGLPVIFLTAYGTIESAVQCMANGAYYYFIKPPDYQDLVNVLLQAVEEARVSKEVSELRKRRDDGQRPILLLGKTAVMKKINSIIEAVKNSESNVLVCGETGTGKELIARALHFTGNRSYRNFVAVNCAAIPRELIEAELFGHVKGAFTGASHKRVGRIEAASGGTLFLDEIGELDISVQSKLLRVLQEKEFSRLGDNDPVSVDFRLIASTNRNLKHEVQQNRFREDLFYRVNVVQISVPPLRERKGDIRMLAMSFLDEFCMREGKLITFSKEALRILEAYPWPGNVRELKNIVERLVVLSRGKTVKVEDLPDDIRGLGAEGLPNGVIPRLRDVELQAISDALLRCDGNKARVARLLGLSRKTLYKRIRDYNLG